MEPLSPYNKELKAKLNSALAKSIGEKVRAIRVEKGYSMVDLANYLDTTRQSVYKIENGEYCASIQMLYMIAEAFKCDIRDFMPEQKIEIK